MELYIFRHGETDYNVAQRFQGSIDEPLNDCGRAQARALAMKLLDKNISALYASPLQRAYESANIVASHLGVPVHVAHNLREIHCGDAEGCLRADVIARYGEEFWRRWQSSDADHLDIRFQGGESKRECRDRGLDFLAQLATSNPGMPVALATHGAFIKNLLNDILPATTPPIKTPNCALFYLRIAGHQPFQVQEFQRL